MQHFYPKSTNQPLCAPYTIFFFGKQTVRSRGGGKKLYLKWLGPNWTKLSCCCVWVGVVTIWDFVYFYTPGLWCLSSSLTNEEFLFLVPHLTQGMCNGRSKYQTWWEFYANYCCISLGLFYSHKNWQKYGLPFVLLHTSTLSTKHVTKYKVSIQFFGWGIIFPLLLAHDVFVEKIQNWALTPPLNGHFQFLKKKNLTLHWGDGFVAEKLMDQNGTLG